MAVVAVVAIVAIVAGLLELKTTLVYLWSAALLVQRRKDNVIVA